MKNQAIELYKTHPAPEVAKILGKSEATIRRWVKGCGKINNTKYRHIVDHLIQVFNTYGEISADKEHNILSEHLTDGYTRSIKSFIRKQVVDLLGNNNVFVGKLKKPTVVRDLESKARDIHRSMMHRCYNINNPAYKMYGAKGVTVCDAWHDPNVFTKWYIENYVDGWALDKDLLSSDNKIYSPETCCLMPSKVNTALSSSLKGIHNFKHNGSEYVKTIRLLSKVIVLKADSLRDVEEQVVLLKQLELEKILFMESLKIPTEHKDKFDNLVNCIRRKYLDSDRMWTKENTEGYSKEVYSKDLSDVAY